MQQRRLGQQTWPVSMETGEGRAHFLSQVFGPQAALPNSVSFLGEQEGTCQHISSLS